MQSKELKNKPLVEAIFEARWQLQAQAALVNVDPHYKLLLGRFFDQIRTKYPHHEQLQSASIPDEFVGYTVQHRFRQEKDGWPLVQIGPGIVTCNETSKYTWTDFHARANETARVLFNAYPEPTALKVQSLVLRFINAVEFDHSKNDVLQFLREKMKVNVALPNDLFSSSNVGCQPTMFQWQATFPCTSPKSAITLRFATGTRENSPALVWETMLQSNADDADITSPCKIGDWLGGAHHIADDWFFKLISGDLERSFQ